jgi:hypothetical protein
LRKATQVNRELAQDPAALGLRKRINYDSRATFRSLVLAVRPDLEEQPDVPAVRSPEIAAHRGVGRAFPPKEGERRPRVNDGDGGDDQAQPRALRTATGDRPCLFGEMSPDSG